MKILKRVMKRWSKHNVPEEIWPEILCNLPVKFLLRFRSVCKSWQTFIDDPNFARLHLTRFKNNRRQSHLFAVQVINGKATCVVKSRSTLRTTGRLSELDIHFKGSNIICSVDGLFLLIDYTLPDKKLILCNPSVRKTLIVPHPPNPWGVNYFEFGLGFDPLIQDYKIVIFLLGIGRGPSGVKSVAIYTVGTNSWKSIEFQDKGCSNGPIYESFVPSSSGQITFCLKGVLYALVTTKLVSFDLNSELFDSCALPVVNYRSSLFHKLTMVDDGSSLAMFYMSVYKEGSIWVLENPENDIESSSWTQRYTFGPLLSNISFCLGDIGFVYLNKNVELFLKGWTRVLSINLETKEEKIVLKKRLDECQAWPYMESLLLR